MPNSRSVGRVTTPEGRSSIDHSQPMTSNASKRRIPPGRKPVVTAQPFENAAQQPDTTKPAPECPPATTAPQNGIQGRKGVDPNYQHGYRDGQNNCADRTQP